MSQRNGHKRRYKEIVGGAGGNRAIRFLDPRSEEE